MPELDGTQPSDQTGSVYDQAQPWMGMWIDPQGGGRIVVIQPLDAGSDVVMFTYTEDEGFNQAWLNMCEATDSKPDVGDYVVRIHGAQGWYVIPYGTAQVPITPTPFEHLNDGVAWTRQYMRENQRKGRIWSLVDGEYRLEETL